MTLCATSSIAFAKWENANDLIRPTFEKVEAVGDVLHLTTKSAGEKWLISVNGSEKKLLEYNSVIKILKSDHVELFAKHKNFLIKPYVQNDKLYYALILGSDERSTGRGLKSYESAFSIDKNNIVASTKEECGKVVGRIQLEANEENAKNSVLRIVSDIRKNKDLKNCKLVYVHETEASRKSSNIDNLATLKLLGNVDVSKIEFGKTTYTEDNLHIIISVKGDVDKKFKFRLTPNSDTLLKLYEIIETKL